MHICMFTYMHRRMGTICFLSKLQNFFFFAFGSKMVFAEKKKRKKKKKEKKEKGTQQLRLEVSFAMKSTIFTCEWLKEKGNNACTYVSIHVYTYTQMNKHYFIIKHYFFEKENPFGSKNYSCRKKKGTTAMAGGVFCYEQCKTFT